jgi:hypothetical protein
VPSLSLTDRLASLPRMQKEALAPLWQEIFQAEPPVRMRKEMMVQFLAYRMQEQEFGPLSERNQNRLCQLAKAIRDSSNTSSLQKVPIKAGTICSAGFGMRFSRA